MVICDDKIKLLHIKTGARASHCSDLDNGGLESFYDIAKIHSGLFKF